MSTLASFPTSAIVAVVKNEEQVDKAVESTAVRCWRVGRMKRRKKVARGGGGGITIAKKGE